MRLFRSASGKVPLPFKSRGANRWVGLIIAVHFAMIGIGIVCFPDAPLRLQGEVSVGKFGEVHSREDFRRFKLWERTFIGTGSLFALTALVCLTINLKRTRERRKSGETA